MSVNRHCRYCRRMIPDGAKRCNSSRCRLLRNVLATPHKCRLNGVNVELVGVKTYDELCELAGQPIGATCTYVFKSGGNGELKPEQSLGITGPCSISCVVTGVA